MVAAAVIGGAVVGAGASYASGRSAAKSADNAADAQGEASNAQIAESRYQFDKIQKLLDPFVQGGTKAFGAQGDILGLNGPGSEQNAINAVKNSPTFEALLAQGENSILQNASATGGLRGGNTQQALSQFSPQLLSQLIQQRYQNLGGLTNIGQASAAGVGNAAQNTGAQINASLGDIGAARAGSALAGGQAQQQLYSNIGNTAGMVGTIAGLKYAKAF